MTRGFTLIELVVTLAIAGIAAAVAVPALGSLLREEPLASASARELLDRARRTAGERGSRVTVVLVPETAHYWVRADTAGGRVTLAEGVLALAPDAGFEVTRPRLALTFDPYGGASGDTLVVRTASGAELVLGDRWTGEVRVVQR